MQYIGSVTSSVPVRFVPNLLPPKELRLTKISMQAAEVPESYEIDLAPYQEMIIAFEGQNSDDQWVWGVKGDIRIHRAPTSDTTYLEASAEDTLARRPENEVARIIERQVHLLSNGIICATDSRASKRSRTEIVLEATGGFIPLWAEHQVLRWRFNEVSLATFRNPETIKTRIRELLMMAITAWGAAVPIRFNENSDNSDFEIIVEGSDNCTPLGCTLAKAFFPDAGRHQLYFYPQMFDQSEKEQIDTLIHEIGHIFGLRHFFAPEAETNWPSVIFGEHKPFSIMNYGKNSELTEADRNDLKLLYESVWKGQLTAINNTPVKLVTPYSSSHPILPPSNLRIIS